METIPLSVEDIYYTYEYRGYQRDWSDHVSLAFGIPNVAREDTNWCKIKGN